VTDKERQEYEQTISLLLQENHRMRVLLDMWKDVSKMEHEARTEARCYGKDVPQQGKTGRA
jgi:hypothetical protein